MKFYPADWRADPALRMCSIGARGLWIEILCLMHEAEPYGYLRIKGHPITPKKLAILVGISASKVSDLLTELEAQGVFSREDGEIFSRRMVRDSHKRELDVTNGKRGGNPNLKRRVNPSVHSEDKGQKSESKSQNPEIIIQSGDGSSSAAESKISTAMFPETDGLVAELFAIIGWDEDSPERFAASQIVNKWLAKGWHPELIVISVRKVMARPDVRPTTLHYFEGAIADTHCEFEGLNSK
jgi:hypothetical protein